MMSQLWRQLFVQPADECTANCGLPEDDTDLKYQIMKTEEYWKEKIFKEREDYKKSLNALQRENRELQQFIKKLQTDPQRSKIINNRDLCENHSLISSCDDRMHRDTAPSPKRNFFSFNSIGERENIQPNRDQQECNDELYNRGLNIQSPADTEIIADLKDQLQILNDEKKLLRSKCKSHIVKLNAKIVEQNNSLKSVEAELLLERQLNEKLLRLVEKGSSVAAPTKIKETSMTEEEERSLGDSKRLESQLSRLEIQLMNIEDFNALQCLKIGNREIIDTDQQDVLCVLGLLQGKYDRLKMAFSEKTQKLSEKVKALQSALLTKVNENKNLKTQNNQLEIRIQSCQKDFAAIKAKLIGMRDDQTKYLSKYESQLSSLNAELRDKNRDLERLQVVVKNDKERFSRMKSSIHKIVELNKTSSSSIDTQNGYLHDEMHRIYVQEIHKRFDELELQDLSDLAGSMENIKSSLCDELSSLPILADAIENDQSYNAVVSAMLILSEDGLSCSDIVQHIKGLLQKYEEKSNVCDLLLKETRILRERLGQMEGKFNISKLSYSLELPLDATDDATSDYFDANFCSSTRNSSQYAVKIIELETKITQLQQEISTMSRITPNPTPNKSFDV